MEFTEVPAGVELDIAEQFDESSMSLSQLPVGTGPVPAFHSAHGTLHIPRGAERGQRLESTPYLERHSSDVVPVHERAANAAVFRNGRSTENVRVPMVTDALGSDFVPLESDAMKPKKTSASSSSRPLDRGDSFVPIRKVKSVIPMRKDQSFVQKTFDEFGTGKFTVITTTKRHNKFHLYRKARLRQEWLDLDHSILRREKDERRTGFQELYYDLIFVAVIAQFGHEIRLQATFSAWFFLEFISLFNIWMLTTFYQDRFDTEDGFHKFLSFIIMAAVVGLGNASHVLGAPNVDTVQTAYIIAYLCARVAIEVGHLLAWTIKSARPYIMHHLLIFVLANSFWLTAVFVTDSNARIGLVVAGFSIDMFGPVTTFFLPRKLNLAIPINLEHILERFGLFSIIILGETVVSVLFQEPGKFNASQWAASILGLLLSWLTQWIYFDIENGHHGGLSFKRHALRRGGIKGYSWIMSHIPADLAIVLYAAGVWNVVHFYSVDTVVAAARPAGVAACNKTAAVARAALTVYDPLLDPCVADPFYYGRWLLCVGTGAALLFITINGLMHKRTNETVYVKRWMRIIIRGLLCLSLFLIPLAGTLLSPLQYLAFAVSVYGLAVMISLERREAVDRVRRVISSMSSLSFASRREVALEVRASASPPDEARAFLHRLESRGLIDLQGIDSVKVSGNIPDMKELEKMLFLDSDHMFPSLPEGVDVSDMESSNHTTTEYDA